MVSRDDVIEQLFGDICHLSHRHEVQYWLDAPGTPEERLRDILTLARKGLALVRGKIEPHHV